MPCLDAVQAAGWRGSRCPAQLSLLPHATQRHALPCLSLGSRTSSFARSLHHAHAPHNSVTLSAHAHSREHTTLMHAANSPSPPTILRLTVCAP